MTDLLALTAELIDIPSASFEEAALADVVEQRLRATGRLQVDRVGNNVVARTDLGRAQRVLVVGHLDTVPANGNERARIEGDTLHGLGASDMKGGLAVMLDLAETIGDTAVDVTWVFYACEEVAAVHNGLGVLFAERPDLLAGDVAILGEPTGGAIEAGCQGTMRIAITLRGERAHTARPWMGRNAIHRVGRLVSLIEVTPWRRPVIDGCEYREALQAVFVEGGVAGNVVPDEARITLNHRFAPDKSPEAAEHELRALLGMALDDGDAFEVVDVAAGAAPGLDHPLLAALVARSGLEVRAKLGWTDVARFAAAGVPACNLGPGDPTIAHTAGEHVDRASLEATHAVLADLLRRGDGR